MIATSARRSATWAVVSVLAAALALASVLAAHADAPIVTTRADTTIDVATNLTTGTGTTTELGALTLTASGGEFNAAYDIRIVAPAGWSFDTSATVEYSLNAGGTLRINGGTGGSVTAESASTIMLDVTAGSTAGDTLTITGISVMPNSEATASGRLGLSLDGDATVGNGADDSTDITLLTAGEVGVGVGTFDRPIAVIGVTPAQWNGGTTAQMEAAVSAVGGVSATIFVEGSAVVLIPGAPTFVNAEFNAEFSGNIEAGTIVLVVR